MQLITILETVIETALVAGPDGIEVFETAITTSQVDVLAFDLSDPIDLLLLELMLTLSDEELDMLLELEELLDAMDGLLLV